MSRRSVVAAAVVLALGLGLAALAAGKLFAWADGHVYPVGDQAILEIYTRHAAHGIWPLGPYSQFGWHHPGPLYFYLLAPLYWFSGEKTIALHAGAFAINLLSLCVIAFVLLRYAAPEATTAAAAAMGLYLFRLPIAASYWNPHIVILPAAAFLVLCAAAAAGRAGALPAAVLVGSFLVQTHVSLAPYVLLLGGGALAAVLWLPTQEETRHRSLRKWIGASLLLFVLVWALPMWEQVSHTPGNLTRLVRFFAASSPGQSWGTALVVWGDTIGALFRRQLDVPAGSPLPSPAGSITVTTIAAILQVLLLALACLNARRRQDRFHAALTGAGMLASLTALWSITRVTTLIGDYMIFWVSAIGALNWAVIAGLALTRLSSPRLCAVQQWAAIVASALVVWAGVHFGSIELRRARRTGLMPPRGSAQVIEVASQAVLDDMQRQHVQRPLIQMVTQEWGEAAGVLLQIYKRGARPGLDPGHVWFFGEPLAPDGREDRLYVIADAKTHPDLANRPGFELIAAVEGMYVHASPLVPRLR